MPFVPNADKSTPFFTLSDPHENQPIAIVAPWSAGDLLDLGAGHS